MNKQTDGETRRERDAAIENRTEGRGFVAENRSDETPLLGEENTPLPAQEPATEPVQADGSAITNQETTENVVPDIIPDNT